MKTQSIQWRYEGLRKQELAPPPPTGFRRVMGQAGRALAAAAVAFGIMAGAALLLAVPQSYTFVQALTWASSFVCFTAAIRTGSRGARVYLLIGAGLMVFVLSSMKAAPGFAFMALMLVAVWAASALYRKSGKGSETLNTYQRR